MVSKMFWFFCVFCRGNCNVEYRIRILCIELYMGTLVKDILRPKNSKNRPPKKSKNPRSVNNFHTKHLGGYLGDFWSPKVATVESPLEATEASSCAQLLARDRESSPLTTPPGPRKLRLLGNKSLENMIWANAHGCKLYEESFADSLQSPN